MRGMARGNSGTDVLSRARQLNSLVYGCVVFLDYIDEQSFSVVINYRVSQKVYQYSSWVKSDVKYSTWNLTYLYKPSEIGKIKMQLDNFGSFPGTYR